LQIATIPLAQSFPSAPLDPSLTVRPRQLNPPDELTLDRDYIHQLQTVPVVADERDPQTGEYLYPGAQHKPSRGGAFLRTVLKALAPSIANAQAEAYATGRTPGWDTLATGLAGAVGGGVVGAINPTIPLQMKRQEQLQGAQRRYAQDYSNAAAQSKLAANNARAQEPYVRIAASQMAAASKAQADARKEEISRLLTQHDRAGHYNPDDPKDPSSKFLKTESARLGVELVPYDKAQRQGNPQVREVDGVTYERSAGGKWIAAEGLPVDRTKASVVEQGLTVAPGTALSARATAAAANATAGRFGVEQANRAEDRTVADERYSETRYRDDSSKASEFYTKMEKSKADALLHARTAHDLFAQSAALDKSSPTYARDLAELRAKGQDALRQQTASLDDANAQSNVLKTQYAHIYKVEGGQGEDGMNYPSARQLPRPPAPRVPSRNISGAPAIRRTGGGGRHYVAPKVSAAQLQGLLR
jgi:hypothetical protein